MLGGKKKNIFLQLSKRIIKQKCIFAIMKKQINLKSMITFMNKKVLVAASILATTISV